MTKDRQPLSATWAFMKSISALGTDPETALEGFELAKKLTGRSKSALYRAMNPDDEDERERAPIYLDDVEIIDDWNAAHGKRRINFEAWEERNAAKDAGLDGAGPDPIRLLDRAIANLSDAIATIRNNAVDLGDLRSRFVAISDLEAELTRMVMERDRRKDIRPEKRATQEEDADAEHEDRLRVVAGARR